MLLDLWEGSRLDQSNNSVTIFYIGFGRFHSNPRFVVLLCREDKRRLRNLLYISNMRYL